MGCLAVWHGVSLEIAEQALRLLRGVRLVAGCIGPATWTFLVRCLSLGRGFVSQSLGCTDARRHSSTCAHIVHSVLKVINVFERLNDVEDASGGTCGDESVRGPLALGPALLFSPDVVVSFSKGKVL